MSFSFKVYEDDWAKLFSDEKVFCPLCRHEAPAQQWFTTEQVDNAKEQAYNHAVDLVGNALKRGAQSYNRKPQKGFIKFSHEVKGTRGVRGVVPIPAGEKLDLKIQCEKCSARSAVVGSAFFCPCCGHNSVIRTFDDSLRKIEVKLNSAELIKKQFSSEGKRDDGEILVRSMIETSLSDCVVAIQRLSEQLYISIPGVSALPQNIFQRIDDSNKLLKEILGCGYEDWLNHGDLEGLKLLFQRRHLLAHCEGIVDQRYIERSKDSTYKVGQRIVVKDDDVRYLKELVRKIAAGIRIEMNKYGYSI